MAKIIIPECETCGENRCYKCGVCGHWTCLDCQSITGEDTCIHRYYKLAEDWSWREDKTI